VRQRGCRSLQRRAGRPRSYRSSPTVGEARARRAAGPLRASSRVIISDTFGGLAPRSHRRRDRSLGIAAVVDCVRLPSAGPTLHVTEVRGRRRDRGAGGARHGKADGIPAATPRRRPRVRSDNRPARSTDLVSVELHGGPSATRPRRATIAAGMPSALPRRAPRARDLVGDRDLGDVAACGPARRESHAGRHSGDAGTPIATSVDVGQARRTCPEMITPTSTPSGPQRVAHVLRRPVGLDR